MNERRFGLKGLFATGAGAASVVGGLGSVAAQEDDEVVVEEEESDVEVSAPGEDPVVTSGDVTASVIDGVATVEFAEEDEDESDEGDEGEEGEEEDEDESVISADAGLAISDASGGDGNFAFVS